MTDTIVMAHEKRMMPTIARMLSALSDERADLLSAIKKHRDQYCGCSQCASSDEQLEAAIAKAES